MRTESNRSLIRDMYAAAQRGDAEGFFSVMAADIIVDEPTFLSYCGRYQGINELQRLFGMVTQILDVANMRVDRLIADEDHVLGFIRVPVIAGGEVALAELSVIRDGKVREMRIYFHDTGPLSLSQPEAPKRQSEKEVTA